MTSATTNEWTAQRVRAELPAVTVNPDDGTIYAGTVSGRLNEFATVHIKNGSSWFCCGEFAWQTIANALNNGRPLRI